MNVDSKNPPRYYSIGKVAKELDLPAYTIRYWETEFKQLRPKKSRSGRRVYSQEDLKLVAHIRDLLHNQGYTIKGAREALEGNLKSPVVVSSSSNSAPEMPSEREIYLEDRVKELEARLNSLEEEKAEKPDITPAPASGPTENEIALSQRVSHLEAKLKEQKLALLQANRTAQTLAPAGPGKREIYLENKLRTLKRQLQELHQILAGK